MSLAVGHVRAVRPQLFNGVTQVDLLVTRQDKESYIIQVDNYPASLVAMIVKTLRNMGENPLGRSEDLQLFAQRLRSGEVDLRVLYESEPSAQK